VALGSGAVAQSPSPPPWFGGRVEMPEHGFAWMLPEGWVGFDPSADIEAQIDAAFAAKGSDTVVSEATVRRNLAEASDGGAQLVAGDLTLGVCAISVTPSDLSLDAVEEAVVPGLGSAAGVLGFDGPTRVELPSGPAVVVSFSSPVEGYPGVTTTHSTYLVIGEGHIGIVACGAADAPAGGLRSRAETFEFIPRRYEQPDVGVAISYPLGWEVMSFDPAEERYGLMMGGIGDVGMCQLSDETVTLPQDSDEQPFDQVLARGLWGQFEDRVDISGLHRSVERATRLDAPLESRYYLAADDRLVGLSCNTTPDRLPDDRWMSIAESFEFLPIEE
jgi:hypothetical protein